MDKREKNPFHYGACILVGDKTIQLINRYIICKIVINVGKGKIKQRNTIQNT